MYYNRMDMIQNIEGKTLIGLDNTLFLINDSQHELNLHYDEKFVPDFSKEYFTNEMLYKKNVCNSVNSKYFFLIIPDKSVICKEKLPFEVGICRRDIANFIKTLENCYDLFDNSNLEVDDYFKADSHINFSGAKKVVKTLINTLFPTKIVDLEQFDENKHNYNRVGDLMTQLNYKYTTPNANVFIENVTHISLNANVTDNSKNLPFNFKFVYSRQTLYHINKHPIIDTRVLVLCDSSTNNFLSVYLSSIFSECLYYWDHGFFNEDLVKFYNPDIILEIRTERLVNGNNKSSSHIKHAFYDKICNANSNDTRECDMDEIVKKMKKFTNVSDDEVRQNLNKCTFILKYD